MNGIEGIQTHLAEKISIDSQPLKSIVELVTLN